MRDARNIDWFRVADRNIEELQAIKRAVERVGILGTRVLQDILFLVKIDSVNQVAVVDSDSGIRPGIAEEIGKENNVKIEKISWLCKKENMKPYRSIVIYLTKESNV